MPFFQDTLVGEKCLTDVMAGFPINARHVNRFCSDWIAVLLIVKMEKSFSLISSWLHFRVLWRPSIYNSFELTN